MCVHTHIMGCVEVRGQLCSVGLPHLYVGSHDYVLPGQARREVPWSPEQGRLDDREGHWECPPEDKIEESLVGTPSCRGLVQAKEQPKKLHLCALCGKNFSNNSNLIRHQRIHAAEKLCMDVECGEVLWWTPTFSVTAQSTCRRGSS